MNLNLHTTPEHLLKDYYRPIRDPLWGHIYLSDPLMSLIHSEKFQQLSRIKQLGPCYLVYPGATHTRLNHSIGVFHIAFRMINHFVAGAVRSNNRELQEILDPRGVKSFLCAALLHDLGHFPFTHSLKELPLKEHEELTAEIITSGNIKKIIQNELDADPNIVAGIVDTNIRSDDPQINFFRKILSAPIDPDKLDYLNRDAYFCGVPYGQQDVDYILSRIQPDLANGVIIEDSGIAAIEGLLFAKYLMYRAVYWHQSVRIATGMIKKSLFLGLSSGEIGAEELYGLDDDGFFTRFGTQTSRDLSLIQKVYNREFHKVIFTQSFDAANEAHLRLENLAARTKLENTLLEAIRDMLNSSIDAHEILVDIPERVSFEIQMNIKKGNTVESYNRSNSVFSPAVVKEFTNSLRLIRFAVSSSIKAKMQTKKITTADIQKLGEKVINQL